ncbi:accessory gland protein Acp53Ea [Scaptodrosophila lebanonensis]|uniref:Accessory gland protein Acp53Ea n=1 Tax=Drosophila lebanonensis TaxID=7225 RepID=A0A6J2UHD4_DROLE|nr:accessory gland protein Acp53Ea [Scaptodrosophila lebanonensis]
MELIKVILCLSILSLFSSISFAEDRNSLDKPTAEPYDWDKIFKCGQIAIEGTAAVAVNVIGIIKHAIRCIDFKAPPNPKRSIIRTIRTVYEFMKRLLLNNVVCLIESIQKIGSLVKPHIDAFEDLNCLDENDI